MRHVRLAILVVAALCLLGTGWLDKTAKAQSLTARLKAEGAASLAGAARERGNAVGGAILFSQQVIGCANCHAPGGQDLLGPDLSELGADATDVYLAETMLYPSKVIRKGFESVTVITLAGKSYAGRVIDKAGDHVVLRLAAADRWRRAASRSCPITGSRLEHAAVTSTSSAVRSTRIPKHITHALPVGSMN